MNGQGWIRLILPLTYWTFSCSIALISGSTLPPAHSPTWSSKQAPAPAPAPKLDASSPSKKRPVSAPALPPTWNAPPPRRAMAPAPAPVAARKLFLDYIGASGQNITFNAPINKAVNFYYILGFAVDASPNGTYNNGHFVPVWNTDTLTPQAVINFKAAHGTAKVMMSLCGWSIYTDSQKDQDLFWYDPKDSALWLDNAFASISSLVRKYHLDGIDVDYENFKFPNKFSDIMGKLITRLREHDVLNFVTIAPLQWAIRPYLELYKAYSSAIDYILYQFYADDLANPKSFLSAYYDRVHAFGGARLDVPRKLIPGYEIKGRGVQGQDWWDAIALVQNSTGYELSGMFMWSADESKALNYSFEMEAQAYLVRETKQMVEG